MAKKTLFKNGDRVQYKAKWTNERQYGAWTIVKYTHAGENVGFADRELVDIIQDAQFRGDSRTRRTVNEFDLKLA